MKKLQNKINYKTVQCYNMLLNFVTQINNQKWENIIGPDDGQTGPYRNTLQTHIYQNCTNLANMQI